MNSLDLAQEDELRESELVNEDRVPKKWPPVVQQFLARHRRVVGQSRLAAAIDGYVRRFQSKAQRPIDPDRIDALKEELRYAWIRQAAGAAA